MNSAIKSRFDDARLADVLNRYELDTRYRLLSDWHAFTFEVYENGKPLILRVADDTHRTLADVEGELEWMAFVRNNGVAAPLVIPSRYGRSAELIDAGPSKFTSVLFDKLNGNPVSDGDWNPRLFERWGALIGRLHRLSANFRPSKRRAQWHESDFLNIDTYIPDGLSEIKCAARELIDEIKALPRVSASFGLMHADVYQDNFFISKNGLQLFDFDNCEYGFYANDLAISLYAALWRLRPEDNSQAFAAVFLESLWTGYCTENSLDQSQLENLPLFLRLRDLLIYIVARKKLDLENLTPIQARLLSERGRRIALRTPVVDVGGMLK